MRNFFNNIQYSIKQKSKLFILLISLTIASIILGIVAGINFLDGILVIDLSNISYIQFLKDEINFVSLFFRLSFALTIFIAIVFICNSKSFLIPFAVIFYMYLIYSQVVIISSIILIYGFFNSVILVLLLIIYILLLFLLFLLIFIEANCYCNSFRFFKEGMNSNFLTYLILTFALTFIFCLVLNILKSFVILLIY